MNLFEPNNYTRSAACLGRLKPVLAAAVFALLANPISAERMARDLRLISGPEFGGRMTLSPSMRKTADFLAKELKRSGVKPNGLEGSYFHEFDVTINRVATERNFLTLNGKPLRLGVDFQPCNGSADMRLARGSVAFVGFGRNEDYAGFDVSGKVVVVLRGLPDDKLSDSMNQKAARAAERGAVGMLFVGPETPGGQELAPLAGGFSISRANLPGASISAAAFRNLVGLDASQARRQSKPQSRDLKSEARLVTESKPQTGRALNVLGIIPGTGEAAQNLIVIGAHYDHLGFGETSSRTGHDAMHAGADDNGSGTVAVLELARRLAQAKSNRHTILIQFYSGEEIGLLGSRAWTMDFANQLPRIQAMVNLDMVGRLREEGLTVYGTGTAAEMNSILDRAGPDGLKLVRQPASPSNSDHASFSTRGVPVLFFNTGLHDEYHTERDTFPTINLKGLASVTDYVYRVIGALDSTATKLKFTGSTVAGGASGDPSRPRRVRFGVQPDMTEVSGRGLMVNGVTTDSPAAKAGIKIGDRILTIGGTPVNSVQDLQAVLVAAKAGVPLEVVLLRADVEIKLIVTPEEPVGG